MRIFLSYARVDQQRVQNLERGLALLGHQVWLDRNLAGGAKWWPEILRQIRSADVVLVVVSGSALSSIACTREREYALALGKPLLPVALEDQDRLRMPREIAELQVVDYLHVDAPYFLGRALNELPKAPPLPAPLPPEPLAPSNQAGLAELVEAPELTRAEQQSIVESLREQLSDPADWPAVVNLTQMLLERPDLFAVIERQLLEVLAATPPPTGGPTTHAPTVQPIQQPPQRPAPRPGAGNRGSLVLRFAARTDVGLIRDRNMDSVYAGPRLLAVADGGAAAGRYLGGRSPRGLLRREAGEGGAKGDVASSIIVRALAPLDDDDFSAEDLVEALRGAIGDGNKQVRDAIAEKPALEGMGTTLTALLLGGEGVALAHIGSSRAYAMRDDQLQQITKDDTHVQLLLDEGRITAEEDFTDPDRSLLTAALDGREINPSFFVRRRRTRPGDRYLICSDGLSSVVSTETIAEAMRLDDPREAANRLIQLALRGGGPDNITVIVADIIYDPSADTAAGRAALAAPRHWGGYDPERGAFHS